MSLVQVGTLITRVRQDCNLEGSTQNPTDAEIMDRLNRAKSEFVDLLRTSGGAGYLRRTFTMPTNAGQSIYSLPADFVSLSFVLAYLTPTQFIICEPFTDDMRPMFTTIVGTGWVFGQPIYYQLGDAGQIEFMPIPTGQFTVTLGYQYAPADFVIDAATNAPRGSINDVNGWSDFMVARASAGLTRKLKRFDESMAWAAEADRLADNIRHMAPLRDVGAAEVVRNVTRTSPAGYWSEDS